MFYNSNVKGKRTRRETYRVIIFCIHSSLKFDCEKLAQEKIEVHRQYVMVNKSNNTYILSMNNRKFSCF